VATDQAPTRVPPTDRTFVAFMRAVRTESGGWLRLVGCAAFGVALVLAKGVMSLLLTALVAVALGVPLGYWYFRRHGRLLGGVRRRDSS
jgi:hypothetical protein